MLNYRRLPRCPNPGPRCSAHGHNYPLRRKRTGCDAARAFETASGSRQARSGHEARVRGRHSRRGASSAAMPRGRQC